MDKIIIGLLIILIGFLITKVIMWYIFFKYYNLRKKYNKLKKQLGENK